MAVNEMRKLLPINSCHVFVWCCNHGIGFKQECILDLTSLVADGYSCVSCAAIEFRLT